MSAPTHHAPITPADLREPGALNDPVLRIAVERARAGSRPRKRDDPHVLALAIEGGGMGGAVSAGMCVMLDALGLVPSFDLIYGCSAGALNGLWTAAGQAPLGATNYEDAASREFISTLRVLRGKPIVDMEFLFDQIATRVKPYSPEGLADGPELRVMATAVGRRRGIVLRDFATPEETLAAVRASCALPVLGGQLPRFRGELLADGGLTESIPYESALRDGASHVLVLRSRAASHRKEPVSAVEMTAVSHQQPVLGELLRDWPGHYNAAADALSHLADSPALRDRVLQVTVPEEDTVPQLEHHRERIVAGLQAGAREVAALLSREPAALLWEPRAYRTTPAPALAEDVPRRAAIAALPLLNGGVEGLRHMPEWLREGAAEAVRQAPERLRGLREAAAERRRPSPPGDPAPAEGDGT